LIHVAAAFRGATGEPRTDEGAIYRCRRGGSSENLISNRARYAANVPERIVVASFAGACRDNGEAPSVVAGFNRSARESISISTAVPRRPSDLSGRALRARQLRRLPIHSRRDGNTVPRALCRVVRSLLPPPPLPSPVPPPFHCPAHSGVYAASVQDEESGGAPPFPGAIHYAELQAVRSGSHCNRRINNPRQRLDRRDKRGRRGRRQPPRGSVLRIPRRPFPKETRALD